MTRLNSLSLQLAVLYWHFVDVVWVGIYGIFYIWGSMQPVSLVELCKDPACVLDTLFQETVKDTFQSSPSFFDTYIR
jgi:hypothetical protein